MKKLFHTLMLLAASTMLAQAAPAIRGIYRTITLSDGSQVRVELRGDEHQCFWADARGNAYMAGEGQTYSRADMKELTLKGKERRQMAQQRRQQRMARRIAPGDLHQPYTGQKRGLIILAQYQDVKFDAAHTRELYNNAANTPGFQHELGYDGSVRDYFYDMSKGQFELTFDVVGPVTLTGKQATYGADSPTGGIDYMAYTMIQEACKAVDSQVNFADYDWDGDGEVDQVMVIYAGHGENGIGGENSVWPHESQLDWPDYNMMDGLDLDGVRVNTYACTSELTVYGIDENDNYMTGLDGIGTLCHEFAHCLGLPDMYDTGNGEFYGMGTWDLMDQGSYNAHAFLPASLTAYELRYIGWQDPIELTEDCTIDDMQALTEGGNTYIIYNEGYRDQPYDREEYYMLENRQPTKWDRGLFGRGLLITHVEFLPEIWAYNVVNWSGESDDKASVHQYCHVVCADNSFRGTYDSNGNYIGGIDIAGDTYPFEGNDSLTNTSFPYAKTYRPNTDGTYRLNKAVTGIHQNDDGTVGFTFRAVDTGTEISDDHFRTGEVFFYESFDQCAGRGGNDGKWGPGANIGSGKFVPDNYDEYNHWDATSIFGANKCARIGSSAKATTALTPMFYTQGKAYVTFLAAPFKGDSNVLRVKVDNYSFMGGGVEIPGMSEAEFELVPEQWTECRFAIFGDGDIDLCFSMDQRVFIDEVKVQAPTLDGPSEATGIIEHSTLNIDHSIYDLQGRKLNGQRSMVNGQCSMINGQSSMVNGIYLTGGKKYIVK